MQNDIVDKFDVGQVWRSLSNPGTRHLVTVIEGDTVTFEGMKPGDSTFGFTLDGAALNAFVLNFYHER